MTTPTPHLSCVIRTTSTRQPLLNNVIRLLRSYAAEAPTFEIILALDAGDRLPTDVPGPWVVAWSPPRRDGEFAWQYLHRKYHNAFAFARGEWIVCVDDDDWFDVARLTMLADFPGDIVHSAGVYVHELRSEARRTYARVMHAPGVLESTVSFRSRLLKEMPLTDPELGLWLNRATASGAVTYRAPVAWRHVMFLHGNNADLAAGRDELRVGTDGTVYDGPNEYKLMGRREAASEIIGDVELIRWEGAVAKEA